MDDKNFGALCTYLEKNDSQDSLRAKTKERVALTEFKLSPHQKARLNSTFSCVQKFYYGNGANAYRLYAPIALKGLFESPVIWIMKTQIEHSLPAKGVKTNPVKI